MAIQRTRLAKYLNQKQRFRATFSEIRHDKENKPEILLLDLYPIYQDGRKIPLRSKPIIVNSRGEQIASDHVWTGLTASFLKMPKEVLYGDVIDFTACVTAYAINRDDVLQKRNLMWQEGKKASEEVFNEYRNYKHSVLEAEYQAMQKASQKAYEAYKQHLLTFQEMKKAQKCLQRDFHKDAEKAYNSMQARQKRRIQRAQKKIADLDLIDYTLSDINSVSWHKRNKSADIFRNDYDVRRINDLKYTKYLAYHSMAVRQKLANSKEGVLIG